VASGAVQVVLVRFGEHVDGGEIQPTLLDRLAGRSLVLVLFLERNHRFHPVVSVVLVAL
jgi:hypothetical protein